MTERFDYDWLIIGSGFGGSVAALRLAEKGYSVGVLEAGRRLKPTDFPKSAWDVRRYFYAPKLGCHGLFRLSLFKDAFITSGAGVGGGSLVYAMTLYQPHDDAFYGLLHLLPRQDRTARRPHRRTDHRDQRRWHPRLGPTRRHGP
jgi:cholesterol oxidase